MQNHTGSEQHLPRQAMILKALQNPNSSQHGNKCEVVQKTVMKFFETYFGMILLASLVAMINTQQETL